VKRKKISCKKSLNLEYGNTENIKKKSLNILLEQESKIHRLSVAIYVNSQVKEDKTLGSIQNSSMIILVKQNNKIIFESPLNPEMTASITTESYIYTHPILTNLNLNIVNPDINKLFWEFRNEKTIFGSDLINNLCNKHPTNKDIQCHVCLDERCLLCSDNAYLNIHGNCELKKVYVQTVKGVESYISDV
jgi:hypothetical protein